MELTINIDAYKFMIKTVKPFVTKDPEFPAIEWFKLDYADGWVTALGLNHVSYIITKIPAQSDEPFSMIIPVVPAPKKVEVVKISEQEGKITFDFGNEQKSFTKPDGKWPKFNADKDLNSHQVINTMTFNPKLLKDVLSGFFDEKYVNIDITEQGFIIRAEHDTQALVLRMNVRKKTESRWND